jgi:hypothetical protein
MRLTLAAPRRPLLRRRTAPDPALLGAFIRAIDNHSHPPALTATGQKDAEGRRPSPRSARRLIPR